MVGLETVCDSITLTGEIREPMSRVRVRLGLQIPNPHPHPPPPVTPTRTGSQTRDIPYKGREPDWVVEAVLSKSIRQAGSGCCWACASAAFCCIQAFWADAGARVYLSLLGQMCLRHWFKCACTYWAEYACACACWAKCACALG
jgi:hypothetical protein